MRRISEPASNRLTASLTSLTGKTPIAVEPEPLERVLQRLRHALDDDDDRRRAGG